VRELLSAEEMRKKSEAAVGAMKDAYGLMVKTKARERYESCLETIVERMNTASSNGNCRYQEVFYFSNDDTQANDITIELFKQIKYGLEKQGYIVHAKQYQDRINFNICW
jgi:hypothetical protein